MCVYFFSKDFKKGSYSMLEAGTGWAVKGVEEIFVFTDIEENIPDALGFKGNTYVVFNKITEIEKIDVLPVNPKVNLEGYPL